jgi:glycosyltransferase involved in cell wall biosynthesis
MSSNPLVSLIVPTKNSQEFIHNCLKSITNQTYKNIEIIVVDNNSTDKTKEIIKDVRDKTKDIRISLYNKGPERSAQRNFGASKSKGKYLLFIDSDMELTAKVVDECVFLSLKSYDLKSRLGGIIIPEVSFGVSFWAKCKALERSFYEGTSIEAARFFLKHIFWKVGGYDEELTGPEDWDLSNKVKEKYGLRSIKAKIRHNEGRLSLIVMLKKKYYYSKNILRYLDKNKKSFSSQETSPIARYRLFLSNPKKLFKNPIIGSAMILMKTAEYAVGGVGFLLKK